MTLKAIFMRADGVLVDSEEIRRLACNRVFAEAGFDCALEPEQFGMKPGFGLHKEGLQEFLRTHVRLRAARAEIEQLASVMQRRVVAQWRHQLMEDGLMARPGVKDLVTSCHSQGIKVCIHGNMPAGMLSRMSVAALGPDAPVTLVTGEGAQSFPSNVGADRVLGAAPGQLGLEPASVLVLEASAAGLSAARRAGLAAVVVRPRDAMEQSCTGALRVIDDLPVLATRKVAAMATDAGSAMLDALRLLHAEGLRLSYNFERSVDMRVADILKIKGRDVKTIGASDAIQNLARRLNEDKVGAMVVVDADGMIEGIVSERDVVRGLAVRGCELLDMPVGKLMTRVVITCVEDDSVQGIAKVMTQRRIRHLPVTENGKLSGLISIGDVLNTRIEEVQLESNVLRDYTIALR